MKVLYLIALACLALVCQAAKTHFKFADCNKKGDSIGTIRDIKISPDPMSFSKNVTVDIADMELLEDMPEGTMMKINVWKITSIFGLPIPAPCLAGIGSCTVNPCDYLHRFKEQACPFFPKGVPCDCPIKKGVYGGTDITVPMPNLGPIIKWIASGPFKVEVKMLTKEKKLLACYTFNGKVIP